MTDITASIARLGNPAATFAAANGKSWTYAKNVWDLLAFGSKIYIGCGNSANSGTDTNTGQTGGTGAGVPILVLDPSTNTFTYEGTISTTGGSVIPQEQVDRFCVINGALATPGNDVIGTDALDFYRLESGSWAAHNNGSPAAFHVFDLAYFNSTLFAGASAPPGGIFASTDDGVTWTTVAGTSQITGLSLFLFNSKLYAISSFESSFSHPPVCWEYSGSGTTFTAIHAGATAYDYQVWFPDQSFTPGAPSGGTPGARLLTMAEFLSKLVYIGATLVNGFQGDSFGLYSLDAMSTSVAPSGVTRRTLPNSATPWDLKVISSTLYVLGSHTSGSDTVVGVYSTTDLSSWTTEFTFLPNNVGSGTQGQAFARSFEKLNGIWYFGLGSNDGTIPANVGDILSYTAISPVTTGRRFLGASRRHRSVA